MKLINIIFFCILILGIIFINTNCGTMFGGSRQTVKVETSPNNISFTVEPSKMVYTAPTSLSLERKNNYILTFEKEGYESRKFEIERNIRYEIIILDVLFTGIVGVAVDWGTGGWYKLSPEFLNITLTKMGGAGIFLPETIYLTLSLDQSKVKDCVIYIGSSEPGVKIYVKEVK